MKSNYDNWLCTEPNSNFDAYCDGVTENINADIFDAHESWIIDPSGECVDIICKQYDEGATIQEAARFIENHIINSLK